MTTTTMIGISPRLRKATKARRTRKPPRRRATRRGKTARRSRNKVSLRMTETRRRKRRRKRSRRRRPKRRTKQRKLRKGKRRRRRKKPRRRGLQFARSSLFRIPGVAVRPRRGPCCALPPQATRAWASKSTGHRTPPTSARPPDPLERAGRGRRLSVLQQSARSTETAGPRWRRQSVWAHLTQGAVSSCRKLSGERCSLHPGLALKVEVGLRLDKAGGKDVAKMSKELR